MLKDRSALAVLFLFVTFLYSPLLLGDKTQFSGDLAFFNLPMKHFLHRAYQEHFLPFWNPHVFLGAPYMASLQSEVFYPPNLLFLIPDFITAVNHIFLFHLILLAGGTYALMRFWNVRPAGALAAATVALLGGVFLSLATISNHFHAAAWVPVIFIVYTAFCQTRYLKWFALSVITVTLQTLAGSPEFSILTVLLVTAWFLTGHPVDDPPGGRWFHVLAWFGVVALALGLTAFQLLPTYAFMKGSIRDGGLSFPLHTQFSMSWQEAQTILFPHPGDVGLEGPNAGREQFLQMFYMGAIPVLFAWLSLFTSRRSVRFWSVSFFLGIFLALGKHNPLYQTLYEWTPFLNWFRFPQKFFLLSAFALVFLTGFGIEEILGGNRLGLSRLRLAWGLGSFGIFVAGVAAATSPVSLQPVMFLLLLAGLVWVCQKGWLSPAWAGPGTILILFLDLFAHNQGAIVMTQAGFFRDPPPLVRELARDPAPFRLYSDPFRKSLPGPVEQHRPDQMTVLTYGDIKNLLMPSFGSLFGVEYVQGFPGLYLKDQVRFDHAFRIASPEEQLRMLGRVNVKYWVAARDWQSLDAIRLANPRGHLIPVPEVLSRAFLVDEVETVPADQQMERWFSPPFDPHSAALLEEPMRLKSSSGFQGEVKRLEYFPNRVVLETEQSGPAMLVLLDGYSPGWEARVNGQPEPLHRADYFFRALPVPPGHATVEMEYHPPLLYEGVMLSSAFLILTATGLVWGARKRR